MASLLPAIIGGLKTVGGAILGNLFTAGA